MSRASKNRNALKHGANTQEVMLPGEKYEDYEVLRAALYLEWAPDGSTEEYMVQTLLNLCWRRRRLERHEQITIRYRLGEILEENEINRDFDNLRALAPKFRDASSAQEVEAALARLKPDDRDFILYEPGVLESRKNCWL